MTIALERPSEPESPKLNPEALKKRLVKDFYLSFKFSQGNSKLQGFLFNGLINHYNQNLAEEDLNWIRSNLEILTPVFEGQKFPKSHIETTSYYGGNNKKLSFIRQSLNFTQKLAQESSFVDEDYMLLNQMIVRDMIWQGEERGYQAEDSHCSYFRDYVLLGSSTGSEAFNSIFAGLADYFRNAELPELLKADVADLAALWEENHPGQQFFVATT